MADRDDAPTASAVGAAPALREALDRVIGYLDHTDLTTIASEFTPRGTWRLTADDLRAVVAAGERWHGELV